MQYNHPDPLPMPPPLPKSGKAPERTILLGGFRLWTFRQNRRYVRLWSRSRQGTEDQFGPPNRNIIVLNALDHQGAHVNNLHMEVAS